MARDPESQALYNALDSEYAAAELRYEQSIASLQIIGKAEESRRLRVKIYALQHEVNSLNERIWEEQERGEEAEVDAEEWQARAVESSTALKQVRDELALKARDLNTATAELASLRDVSADSQKLLKDKLALSRELDLLKPELEHLRSASTSNQSLLTEKLALERELGNIKMALESEKDQVQQMRNLQSRAQSQDAQQSADMESLKRDLAKAQRELSRAGKRSDAEESKRVKDLEKELARETRAREASERKVKELEEDTVERLRQELEAERQRSKSGRVNDSEEVSSLLRKQLSAAKEERDKLSEEFRKAQEEWDADKNVLDDKLEQFRTKLRSTKEKLKQAEADLQEAQAAEPKINAAESFHEHVTEDASAVDVPQTRPSAAKPRPSAKQGRTSAVPATGRPSIMQGRTSIVPTKTGTAQAPRKRAAAEADPDAAIGTPGDVPAAKKARTPTAVGSKSTFSITPFLNKTSNLLSDTPEIAPENPDEPVNSIEDAASPSENRSKTDAERPKALAVASPGKSNPKVVTSKRKQEIVDTEDTKPSVELEPVKRTLVAEQEPSKENRVRQTTSKPLLKARKSLATFASFREGSLPPQQVQQKKKRKLGGGAMNTIFDDDDDGEGETGMSRALAAKRSFGAGLGRAAVGGLRGKSKGPLTAGEGGFMFSPLKKDRRTSQMPGN